MSAAAFLSQLRRLNIRIQVDGGQLKCVAPAGVLTAELRDQLLRLKGDILQFLGFAQALATQQRAIVPLQQNGSRVPVFAVPGHNGDVFCYRALAHCLGDEQPFFGLQPPGVDGHSEPLTRVEDLAAYFAAQIRAFRPHGPYIIAGFCSGGTVAFELAQQLLLSGTDVAFVALFGAPYPTYFRVVTQLRERLMHQLMRVSKHTRALALRSLTECATYISEKLRREAQPGAAPDPVLMLRAKVEHATLCAVRRYTPSHFPGRVCLFLPGEEWAQSAVGALTWRLVARRSEKYYGPRACNADNMLREPNVAIFAELFRRSASQSET